MKGCFLAQISDQLQQCVCCESALVWGEQSHFKHQLMFRWITELNSLQFSSLFSIISYSSSLALFPLQLQTNLRKQKDETLTEHIQHFSVFCDKSDLWRSSTVCWTSHGTCLMRAAVRLRRFQHGENYKLSGDFSHEYLLQKEAYRVITQTGKVLHY